MRGAGPSFGIIVNYTFKTLPTPSNVVIATYKFDNKNAADTASIMSLYQNFTASSVNSAWGSVLNIFKGSQSNTLKISLSATYLGSQSDFTNLIQPLLNKFPSGSYTPTVKSYAWIDAVQALAGSQSINTASAKDYTDTFYAKSIMTPSSQLVTNDAWNAFTTYLASQGSASNTNWFVQVSSFPSGVDSAETDE